MKRWRCPDCGSVHTARPEEYSPGIQYPRDIQLASLERKLKGESYLSNISRQAQQHWMKVFIYLRDRYRQWENTLEGFYHTVIASQIHMIKRVIYSELLDLYQAPYLSFALTIKQPFITLE